MVVKERKGFDKVYWLGKFKREGCRIRNSIVRNDDREL